MKQGIGLPVFPGVSIGPAVVYRKSERTLPVSSGDPALEQAKFDAARETARGGFLEVYVKADVETCIRRDPKNLYKKALEGDIPNFTGLTSPYEIPENPDVVLDTETFGEVDCVAMLTEAILSRLEDTEL